MTCVTHHHACECREKEFEELRSHLAECERVSDIAKKRGAKLAEAKEVLGRTSKLLDALGFATMDGDETIINREAWSDAMSRRDEIDALLKKWGKV